MSGQIICCPYVVLSAEQSGILVICISIYLYISISLYLYNSLSVYIYMYIYIYIYILYIIYMYHIYIIYIYQLFTSSNVKTIIDIDIATSPGFIALVISSWVPYGDWPVIQTLFKTRKSHSFIQEWNALPGSRKE